MTSDASSSRVTCGDACSAECCLDMPTPPSSAEVLINPPGRRLGEHNAIVSGLVQVQRSNLHIVDDFEGPLSIKFMVAGAGHWRTRRGNFRIAGGQFVVLNRGQAYGLEMERGGARESFCPMFQHGFVEDVARSLVEPVESLLDTPFSGESRPLAFSEHLRDSDDALVPRLLAMHAGFRRGEEAAWLSDCFRGLAEALVHSEAEWRLRACRVPALRASTRDEIWRRLHRARDYIHTNATEAIDLAAIAHVACLAPHHFHRLFRQAFGETPHRYRTRLRLARAAELLEGGTSSVTQVCLAVGFDSLGSFSSLFRREFGISPSAFGAGPSGLPAIRKIREEETQPAG